MAAGQGFARVQVAAYGLFGDSPWGLGWLDMVLRLPFVRTGVLEYGPSGDALWDEAALDFSGCWLWEEKPVYDAKSGEKAGKLAESGLSHRLLAARLP
ncbi:MAG TPA: hypothetical protein VK165_04840 [Azonexus sp.]|nr:hypothetical protein [Azonexus sp.]